ncbi:hypothetical protein F5X99DRAFT_200173 [Biscogniauxia marginata]|nr:hypothetical protein F5X99DRAFT_200173 [Biscogniauxia marginata]
MFGEPSISPRGQPPAHLPAENGIHVWRTAVVMPFISFLFVAARFYSRHFIIHKEFTIDDYIVAATMVTVIIHAVLMANATYHGMGLHIWQFTPELNSEYYLWIGISSEFYVLSLAGFKSALVLLYMQLFGISRRFRIACYITLTYTLGYLSCNLLTEFLGCHPIAKKWHSDLPGKCINTIAANIAYGAGHMSSDLIIAILPLPMIWKLRIKSTRQKIGLSLALSCGFLAWAVACVRWAISTYNMLTYDRPWWAGISFTFSILEVNTGLICACAATLSPLWQLCTTRVRGWTTRASISWHASRSEKDKSSWPRSRASVPYNLAARSNDSLESHGSNAERIVHSDSHAMQNLGSHDSGTEPIFTPSSQAAPTYSSVSDDFPPCDLQGLQALAEIKRIR